MGDESPVDGSPSGRRSQRVVKRVILPDYVVGTGAGASPPAVKQKLEDGTASVPQSPSPVVRLGSAMTHA